MFMLKKNLEGDLSQRQIYLEQNIENAPSIVMQLQRIEECTVLLDKIKAQSRQCMSKQQFKASHRQPVYNICLTRATKRQTSIYSLKSPIYFKVIS